jgi:hypothetical protein
MKRLDMFYDRYRLKVNRSDENEDIQRLHSFFSLVCVCLLYVYSDVRSLLIDFSYTSIKWIEIHLLELSHNIIH